MLVVDTGGGDTTTGGVRPGSGGARAARATSWARSAGTWPAWSSGCRRCRRGTAAADNVTHLTLP